MTATQSTDPKSQIRNAATVIVVRNRMDNPSVLMGQRGAKAVFMPNKVVFPGGAVDAGDSNIPLAAPIGATCHARLMHDASGSLQNALCAAAIRETWEETGLIIGRKGNWQSDVPEDWQTYAEAGFVPDASPLQFVFRAITPPGRPRRFDARFFLMDADHLHGDLDDFSRASDELSHLQWIPLTDVRNFNLPFITEVVLAEITAGITNANPPASVPFFNNSDEASLFQRLYGRVQDR